MKKGEGSTSFADFSKKATRKAVLKATSQHPLTIFPIAFAVLGGVATLLFGSSLLTSLALWGGATLGLGSWLVNYFLKNESFANKYITKLQEEVERQNEALLKNLKEKLAKYIDFEDLPYGEQGVKQFSKIQTKFNIFQEALQEKLNVREVTYRRYLGTAEQVYNSVLDNLQKIAATLNSVSSIDTKYILKRMKTLRAQTQMDTADKKEMDTLEKRLELKKNQLNMINKLLTENEEAMTELDKTTSTISQVQTQVGRAEIDLESALKDLQVLAQRAEKYSVKK